MKPQSLSLACCILLGAAGFFLPHAAAQDYPPPPPPPPDNQSGQLEQLPPLEQLLAPIALYPDPIIALILPASTLPDQVQAAAANPSDPNFDPSIQGLEHYPEVLRWMATNATWSQQLGGAFSNSPNEVMQAIQSLRRRAQAAGTLAPSAYEQIVVDANGSIEILPSNPQSVYLPNYDPQVVYWGYPGGYNGSYFAWSEPYPAGDWLSFDFDWGRHALWHGDWYGFHRQYGWNRRPDFEHWHREGGFVGRREYGREPEMWHAPAHPPPRPEFRSYGDRREYSGAGYRAGGEYRAGGGYRGEANRPPQGSYAPQSEARPQSRSNPAYAPSQQRGAYGAGGVARPAGRPYYGAPGAYQPHGGEAGGQHAQHAQPQSPPQSHAAPAQSAPSGPPPDGGREHDHDHQR